MKTEKAIVSLNELSAEERTALFPIVLRKYNPAYSQWFAEEKANLEFLIGTKNIFRIHHIGSTAVPGLLAKPIVDILVEIADDTDVEALITVMPYPEYCCLTGKMLTLPTPPPHLCILKGYTIAGFAEKVYHIHIRFAGDWDELFFRDYLITHPETALQYAILKENLSKRFEHDRDAYTRAKTVFVSAVMENKFHLLSSPLF